MLTEALKALYSYCGILIFRFCENMKKFTLISPRSYGSGLPLAGVYSKQGTMLSPPQSLMDFSPLFQLANHIIAAKAVCSYRSVCISTSSTGRCDGVCNS